MLSNNQRCSTCDSILRSQLVSKNQTLLAPTKTTTSTFVEAFPVSGNETMWFSKSNSIQPPTFPSSKDNTRLIFPIWSDGKGVRYYDKWLRH